MPARLLVCFLLITSVWATTSQHNRVEREDFAESPVFREAAQESGIDFVHFNGMTGAFYLPEITGSGAAFLDYDNDGDLDVYLVQGALLGSHKMTEALVPWPHASAPQDRLYRNDLKTGADGSLKLAFTDVTARSGIVANGYGMGVATGDINNDGHPDLYVSNLGSNQMLLNNGDGTFTDVTSRTGTDDKRWSTSAAFLDYDRDGWLDLFVTNYVNFTVETNRTCYANSSARDYCGPQAYKPEPDRLFHNRGDGTFEDVTLRSGISLEFGSGLGVVTADFNLDGWIDIYVANDGNPNQLWINQQNGTFRNLALLGGAAYNREGRPEAGMGVDAGDFDRDGDEDIFLSHLMEETNTLYVNLGKTFFEDRTVEAGLGLQSRRYTGFGTAWLDYDNDGWLDLLVANGAVRILPELLRSHPIYPLGQPNQLFRNKGNESFADMSRLAGPSFQDLEVSRGAAFGDVDNDGDTDVLVTNNNGRARLLLNQVGNRNRWVGFRLLGDKYPRDMLGARVEWTDAGDRVFWRRGRTDGSYCSAHDPRVLVGLGSRDRPGTVRVQWPSGKVEEWREMQVGRYYTLREGTAPAGK